MKDEPDYSKTMFRQTMVSDANSSGLGGIAARALVLFSLALSIVFTRLLFFQFCSRASRSRLSQHLALELAHSETRQTNRHGFQT